MRVNPILCPHSDGGIGVYVDIIVEAIVAMTFTVSAAESADSIVACSLEMQFIVDFAAFDYRTRRNKRCSILNIEFRRPFGICYYKRPITKTKLSRLT